MKAKFTDISLVDSTLLVDEEALRQRLFILFSTRKGERRFRPDYGNNFEDYLFEQTNNFNAGALLVAIIYVVAKELYIKVDPSSTVTVKDNYTYVMNLNVYSDELGSTFNYTADLKTKGIQ